MKNLKSLNRKDKVTKRNDFNDSSIFICDEEDIKNNNINKNILPELQELRFLNIYFLFLRNNDQCFLLCSLSSINAVSETVICASCNFCD